MQYHLASRVFRFDAGFHLLLFFCEPAVGRPFFVKVFCFHHQSQGFRTSADDVVVDREVGVAWKPVPGSRQSSITVIISREEYNIAASLGAREQDAPEHEMSLIIETGASFSIPIHEFVKRLFQEGDVRRGSIRFVRMVPRGSLAWVISPSCRFRARRDCALQVFALLNARSLFYALEASCRFQARFYIDSQLLLMLDARNLFFTLVASCRF